MSDNSNNYAVAFGISVGAGLATSLGAGIVFFTTKMNFRFLAIGMAFSAGVMIYVSLVEILVKSYNAFTEHFGARKHGYAAAQTSLFGGILLTYFLDIFVHKLYQAIGERDVHGHTVPHEDTLGSIENQSNSHENNTNVQPESEICVCLEGLHKNPETISQNNSSTEKPDNLLGTALITGVAIAMHNFPEGLATFVALSSALGSGIPLAFAIAVHNIPEGVAVALPIYYKSGSKWKAFIWGTLTGVTEPIGAAVGWLILSQTQGDMQKLVYGIMFGVVAGMMTYISFKELIPTAYVYDRQVVPSSIFAGMLVMASSLVAFVYAS